MRGWESLSVPATWFAYSRVTVLKARNRSPGYFFRVRFRVSSYSGEDLVQIYSVVFVCRFTDEITECNVRLVVPDEGLVRFRADSFKSDMDFKVSCLNVVLIGVHSNNSTFLTCDDAKACPSV